MKSRYNGFGFVDDKRSVTISLDRNVYELLQERSEKLLITESQYVRIALLNQLKEDFKDDPNFANRIGTKNLLQSAL